MSTKNNMLTDISAELDKEFGAPGTPEREKFDEEAYAFYTGQILLDARREAKVTQSELAKRINATKSYISRIESGAINPSVGTFYRIINALGLKIEIVNQSWVYSRKNRRIKISFGFSYFTFLSLRLTNDLSSGFLH